MSIFKAYDIRGRYSAEINTTVMHKIGAAIVRFLKCQEMVVGKDARLSSSELSDAFIQGVLEQGCNVIDIGLCSTPMLYFAGKDHPACAMITASHNTAEYNGVKFCKARAMPIGSMNGMRHVEALCNTIFHAAPQKGVLVKRSMLQAYLNFNLQFLKSTKRFHVVVDAGNGMAGLTYDALRKSNPSIQIIPHWFTLDGTFPNRNPNPIQPGALASLRNRVRDEHADLGLALDADADRCIFVDASGSIVRTDTILSILARSALMQHPGATVVHDLTMSREVTETIIKAGGKSISSKVGHANIKQLMLQYGAILGGESSGHLFFQEESYAEDSMIALFKILEIMEQDQKPLQKLVAEHQSTYVKSDPITLHLSDINTAMNTLKQRFKDGKVSYLDGISVQFDSWWFNCRPSNTEPIVRLVVEARSKEEMGQRRDQLLEVIHASQSEHKASKVFLHE